MAGNRGPGVYADQGGTDSALNLTGTTVIKNSAGRLARVTVIASNTAGDAVFNDCATTGAAAAANQILIVPQNTAKGTVIYVNWPCNAGIVLSALGGGTFAAAFS